MGSRGEDVTPGEREGKVQGRAEGPPRGMLIGDTRVSYILYNNTIMYRGYIDYSRVVNTVQ